MTTTINAHAGIRTLADLLERLGGIAPRRIRFHPAPGTATEQDVLDLDRRGEKMCELVDRVLVEKAMGFRESCLAAALAALLWRFVRERNLGQVSGEQGMVRLAEGLVRGPDFAFTSWERLPDRRMPQERVPALAPDLAVEVLSPGNTEEEMARKRREYFAAGVRLVWLIDPDGRTVAVYTSPEQVTLLDEGRTLDGGDVLPGFTLALRELFAELDLQGNV
jgi:Uma2 family endonuclease